jgi:hypothetical protein
MMEYLNLRTCDESENGLELELMLIARFRAFCKVTSREEVRYRSTSPLDL